MKTIIHVLTDRVAPFHEGGLENSVIRISGLFCKSDPEIYVIIYLTSETGNSLICDFSEKIQIIPLVLQIENLGSPFLGKKINLAYQFRIEYFVLRNAFLRNYDVKNKNIFVSFYLTSKGFISQHLSDDFEIPHIALIRGTDFGKDLFNPQRFNIFDFVLNNANFIVCTNKSQIKKLKKISPSNGQNIDVIYNSLDDKTFNLKWTKPNRQKKIFYTDTGYSFKKGTHILICSIVKLIEEHNLSVTLIISGTSEIEELEYWNKYRGDIENKYPSDFVFLDYTEDVNPLLLDADYYCSATLSEGCSNSRITALALGIPVITTRSGEILDIEANLNNCSLAEPGDFESFYNAILKMLNKGNVDSGFVEEQIAFMKNTFCESIELEKWRRFIEKVK
ncbi:MAG: glycosyltransferase family 4 protein [Bacteroidetes bacterium]|nr:glycosyltransferase family 4 protein [Bacteroidota bacterium]